MKKSILFTVIAMLFCMVATYAQEFSIFGGLNISMIQERDEDGIYSNEYKNLLGPNGGLKVAFETNDDHLFFETGLFLSNKGFKMSEEVVVDNIKVDMDASVSLQYLEVPINAKSTMSVGHSMRFYATYGVFVGIGVAGKIKVKATAMGESVTETMDVEWGSNPDEDYFKQLDLGVNFGAGLEISSVIVGLNYSYGLLNVSPYSDGGYKNRTRAFSIMLGYKFPTKKSAPKSTLN